MRTHPLRTLLITTGVIAVLLGVTIGTGRTPNLGLDLQGGISVNLQPVRDGEVVDDVTDEQLDQAIEIIRRRVDGVGVAEPEVTRQGNTITVQIPGAKDQGEVLDLVGRTAQLTFRPVLALQGQIPRGEDRERAEARAAELREELGLPEGVTAADVFADEQAKQAEANPTPPEEPAPAEGAAPDPSATPDPAAPDTAGGDEGALPAANGGNRSVAAPLQDDTTTTTTTPAERPEPLNQWGIDTTDERFMELFSIENGLSTELTPVEDQRDDAEVVLADEAGNVYRLGPVALTGTAVSGATAAVGTAGWTVNPTFKSGAEGIDLFNAIAAQCYNGEPTCPALSQDNRGLLGIVLDDEVLSAPAIQTPSFSADQIQISGSFSQAEAEALAVALRYGSLPIPFEPQQAESVSATLGQGALRAGIISGLIGLGLASLYLLLYYRLLALVAIGALAVSAASLWIIISWLNATVTLAGVVGIVVSVGVTVDSAIVYFESLKERVLQGSSVRAAVDRSFDVAYSTIVKANIASLIGAGVLYWLAVGPVRGFAFYLGAMTLLNLVATYVFVHPATAVLARSALGTPRRLGIPVRREEPPLGVPNAPAADLGASS
jgi:preprotein translocase subunit SecD